MVTARSSGPFLSSARQRAASTSRAEESGPPETASTSEETEPRPANSACASPAETGAASSAVDTLLFPLDALFHVHRGARIFAQDFAERRTSRFLFAQRRQRLPEPQQRIGRLGGGVVFGRDVEERFGGIAEALALKQTLAEPVLRVRRQPIARIFTQERAKAVFGERVILVHDIAV